MITYNVDRKDRVTKVMAGQVFRCPGNGNIALVTSQFYNAEQSVDLIVYCAAEERPYLARYTVVDLLNWEYLGVSADFRWTVTNWGSTKRRIKALEQRLETIELAAKQKINIGEPLWDVTRAQAEAHAVAVANGWWETKRNDGECIALMHSELSEALEALRNNESPDRVTEELADVILRILDFCGAHELPLSEAINRKHEKNKERGYKHGGKLF